MQALPFLARWLCGQASILAAAQTMALRFQAHSERVKKQAIERREKDR